MAQEFAVIPGETYELNYLICGDVPSIVVKVLGYVESKPGYEKLGPAVAIQSIGRDFGFVSDIDLRVLSVFMENHLPLGQRLATTTELAPYRGGRA